MAHLIRCACTPDNMWYVKTFIWLRYKAAQGIPSIDWFLKPIKCLTNAWRDAGYMGALRRRGPGGAVSGFACRSIIVMAVLLRWRTWCEVIAIRGGGVAIGWFRVPTAGQRSGRDNWHEGYTIEGQQSRGMHVGPEAIPFRNLVMHPLHRYLRPSPQFSEMLM